MPSALTSLLGGEHAETRDKVRALLSEPGFAHEHGLDRHRYRQRVFEWCRALAGQGIGALALPPSYGGAENPGAHLAACETIALHDPSLLVVYGVQFGLFTGALLQLGTARHHDRYLRAAGALELIGCFAMTETDHGSNVEGIETTARFDPATETFEIHTPHPGARKDYIGNALDARMAVVFAQLETAGQRRGVHPFLVPLRTDDGQLLPGVSVEDCGEKAGLQGVGNGRITFDHVRIPRHHLLDRLAQVVADGSYSSPIPSPSGRFLAMMGTLLFGRVVVAGAAVSATKTALTIAVRYGDRRRQFGPPGEAEIPLLDYLAHQRRLLPALATTYALHFAVDHAVRECLANRSARRSATVGRRLEVLTAAVKVAATSHAVDAIQACRECCGGQGHLAVNRLGLLRADSEVFTTFEGDNTVLLQLAAKNLLTGLRDQLEDAGPRDLVPRLAHHLALPVASRRPRPQQDRALDAFRWREEHLLAGLTAQIKRAMAADADPAAAFLDSQDSALDLARAHAERVILECFASAVAGCTDSTVRPVLDTLYRLHAVDRLDAARAWFLERRYLGPRAARGLRPEVNRLCRALRPQAVGLVDAFAIPDPVLGAPIARSR